MQADVLARAMGDIRGVDYASLAPAFTAAMQLAGCNTPARAAMFCAQVGHESLGLKYMEEIASGSAYEGRKDLGNTVAGDGKRFKGRGPIQVTGRYNYGAVSQWAYNEKLIPTRTYFLDYPTQLASKQYGFLGVVWYWTIARPRINGLADARDLTGVTKQINGGATGMADRVLRYANCQTLDLLPSTVSGYIEEGDTGAVVLKWQKWLNAMFPSYSKIDLVPQRYGPATVAATKEFQDRSGIDGDGKNVGPQTLAAARKLGYNG